MVSGQKKDTLNGMIPVGGGEECYTHILYQTQNMYHTQSNVEKYT